MLLTLLRTNFTDLSTEGELSIDNEAQQFCYTIEMAYKDGLPGSAIPAGTYPVILAPSPRFELSTDPWIMRYAALMPRIINIPNRTGILIHWANLGTELEGCIAVGSTQAKDFIGESRPTFEKLWSLIEGPARANDLGIRIVGGHTPNAVPGLQDDIAS
jgi:hypothetical protein